MFILKIKDDDRTLDTSTTGSLLLLSAFIIWASRAENNFIISVVAAGVLLLASILVRTLLLKFKINRLLLIIIAAALLLFVAHSLPFFVLVLLMGFVVNYSYIKPEVAVNQQRVTVKKTFSNKVYDWQSFSNIVLKDNLLTLDFKNNKVLQLELEENTAVDESAFNDFCAGKIIQ